MQQIFTRVRITRSHQSDRPIMVEAAANVTRTSPSGRNRVTERRLVREPGPFDPYGVKEAGLILLDRKKRPGSDPRP
jgi:hypothetical protein